MLIGIAFRTLRTLAGLRQYLMEIPLVQLHGKVGIKSLVQS